MTDWVRPALLRPLPRPSRCWCSPRAMPQTQPAAAAPAPATAAADPATAAGRPAARRDGAADPRGPGGYPLWMRGARRCVTPRIACARSAPSRRLQAPRILDADLRTALRTAADTVAKLAAAPDQRGDVAPILALLERARVRLEGEVALGLTFEGGYSQAKEGPVYGGHATGMGPAGRRKPAAPRPKSRSRPTQCEKPVAAGDPPTAAAGPRTTSSSPAATASRSSTTTTMAGWTSISLPPQNCQLAARIPHRNALFATWAAGASRTCRRKRAWIAAAWGRALRRRRRRGRPHRPVRHQLGRQHAVPQQGNGRFEDVAPRPASRPAAGARAARSSTPMPTAISTCTWPDT